MKVEIGDCCLILGDSLSVLPTLPPVDLVLTDPPYRLETGGNSTGQMGGIFHPAHYDNGGDIVECNIDWPDFMPLIFNSMKVGTHAYTMCNNRHVQGMLTAAEAARLKFHNLLAWDKMSCTPNRWYMKNIEFIGFFYKESSKNLNNCSSQQLIACPQEKYGDHPTTKPTALMEYYIRNSTNEGDTVLDPFMGVGSTGIAALNSGRKFIGIEIEEKWFNSAVKRVTDYYEGQRQLRMI